MTLREKLEQYGQFGEGDLPAIKEVLSLTADVTDALILYADENEGNLDMLTSDKVYNLRDKMNALVDGKSEAAGFDNLWATISDTHGRWDEGEIDNATAKAECDAAVADYLGKTPSMFPEEQVMAEHLMELPEGYQHLHNHLGKAIDVNETFVTMTVPVSIAMRVADSEEGDSHYDAVCNLEMMLAQDLEEEYGITTEMAFDYHNPDIDVDQEVK